MIKLLGVVSLCFLSGCSTYGSAFDCPAPDGKFSCQPVSEVAGEVERGLTKTAPRKQDIVYVNQSFHIGGNHAK